MKNKIDFLCKQDLEMNHFFNIAIAKTYVRILGDWTQQAEDYLFSKGFIKNDFLYENDETKYEMELGCLYVILFKD
jgi:hypothetical protein